MQALQACGDELSRERFLAAVARMDHIDLQGFELRYGPSDNQGSDQVFLTMIDRNGRYRPVESLRQAAR